MPVAGEGDCKNKNDDYDQPDVLQPLVWRGPALSASRRGPARVSLPARSSRASHSVIVIERRSRRTRLAGNHNIYPAIFGPAFGIVEGLNPTLIRMKLDAFNPQPAKAAKSKAAKAPAAAAVPAAARTGAATS